MGFASDGGDLASRQGDDDDGDDGEGEDDDDDGDDDQWL